MSTVTLPKGQTALLIMDCQNDIVHEDGKFGGKLTGGTMPRRIREQGILETIGKLAAAARQAGVPVIHVRHAYRPDYVDLPTNAPLWANMKELQALQDGSWGAEIHDTLQPPVPGHRPGQNAGSAPFTPARWPAFSNPRGCTT